MLWPTKAHHNAVTNAVRRDPFPNAQEAATQETVDQLKQSENKVETGARADGTAQQTERDLSAVRVQPISRSARCKELHKR